MPPGRIGIGIGSALGCRRGTARCAAFWVLPSCREHERDHPARRQRGAHPAARGFTETVDPTENLKIDP
ncbi:MAG TPA: hypothetical protein VI565_11480 [Burkholderiales bacterium]|nr:hypothetical protein [Burkholderiales bacterium]